MLPHTYKPGIRFTTQTEAGSHSCRKGGRHPGSNLTLTGITGYKERIGCLVERFRRTKTVENKSSTRQEDKQKRKSYPQLLNYCEYYESASLLFQYFYFFGYTIDQTLNNMMPALAA